MTIFKEIRDYNEIFNALITMIKWTRQYKNSEQIVNRCKYHSPLSYAKEFSTIRFQLPRQSGHTFFIKKLLLQYDPNGVSSKFFKSPVLIFPNKQIIETSGFSPKWHWIGTPTSNTKFLGMKNDAVICDCSSLLSSSDIEKIYDMFKNQCDNNFIFLFIG